MTELQQLVAQTHAAAKAEGATDEQAIEAAAEVKQRIVEVQETDKALAVAKAKAVEKVKQRQETLKKSGSVGASGAGSAAALPTAVVDLGSSYDDLSSPVYEDITRDLRAEKLQILQDRLQALERQQPVPESTPGWVARTITSIKETLTEQMAAARDNPWGAVRGVAEFIPGGVGTAAYAGNASYDMATGAKTAGEVAFELGVSYVAGKAGILACQGLKAAGKAVYRKGASLLESVTEKMSRGGKGREGFRKAVEEDFFGGTKYTDKVLRQMRQGDYHGFPESVTGFQGAGKISKIIGGDGVERSILRIPGEYRGKKGIFELIKEKDGTINHRLFKAYVE